MDNIYYRVKKENCQDINSNILDNSLLEVHAPNGTADDAVQSYIRGLDETERNDIFKKQENNKKHFRKMVKEKIDKYAGEFGLRLDYDLHLRTETDKLDNTDVVVSGIEIKANLLINAVLQYFSDDIVDSIIKHSVYETACKIEEIDTGNTYVNDTTINSSNPTGTTRTQYKRPQKDIYRMPLQSSERKQIQDSYDVAVKSFDGLMDTDPIAYM